MMNSGTNQVSMNGQFSGNVPNTSRHIHSPTNQVFMNQFMGPNMEEGTTTTDGSFH